MPTLDPFQDELPLPPVLEPTSVGPDATCCYRIEMKPGAQKVHAKLPADTPFWGYNGVYPGPTIEVSRDKKVVVEFVNRLEATPETFWPFAVPMGGMHAFIPPAPWTVAHLHGSPNPAYSDGWPDNAYFPGGSQTHHYPTQASAALLWYHDHGNMITRLNVYAGLAGMYLVRDPVAEGQLQLPVGRQQHELLLMLQDRSLEVVDNAFTGRFAYRSLTGISQFVSPFRLVNGVIWPFKKVKRCQYRLRILNGSNGRFFRLKLRPEGEAMTTRGLTVIGVDGGFLHHPVETPVTTTAAGPEEVLTLAPAERADVLIDFSRYPAGSRVTLVDDDRGGTANVMRFDIEQEAATPPAPLPKPLAHFASPRAPRFAAVMDEPARVRLIGLYLVEMMGMRMQTINGRRFHDTAEEMPQRNTEEEWVFLNLVGEAHPMHLHLVNFRVIDRRRVQIMDLNPGIYRAKFDGVFQQWRAMDPATRPALPPGLRYVGNPIPADEWEVSPKDTVRVPADTVTRIRVRFGPQTGVYMYHCHILEHEDMEMMRPMLVVPEGMNSMAGSAHHHGHARPPGA